MDHTTNLSQSNIANQNILFILKIDSFENIWLGEINNRCVFITANETGKYLYTNNSYYIISN